jgi:hypothetical protein
MKQQQQKQNGENKTKRHLVSKATNKILKGPSKFNKILQAASRPSSNAINN